MPILSSLAATYLDYELGTSSTNLFTTARRQQAIKLAEQEFADLTGCLERRSTVTVTGGTAEYNLNSTTILPGGDFSLIAAQGPEYHYTDASSNVTYLAGPQLFPQRDIQWLNLYEPGWRQSTGSQTPHAWYLRPDGGALYFGLVDKPSTGSSASAQLLIPYIAVPSTDASSTYVPFTLSTGTRADLDTYHPALVHWAAHHLEKLRMNTVASDRGLQKFAGYVARYLQSKGKKVPNVITFARRYLPRRTRQAAGSMPYGIPDPYRWP